ncbi:hypothetical protein PS664_04748 [Pseudomonas fluorescens]|nr:hypothetical protein PS664_04748 [Pseudomonas fluorescens]
MEEVSFDFDQHREQSIDEFREVRGLYESLAETTERILRDTLNAANVSTHSIQARTKTVDSFGNKASKPSSANPLEPKYANPLEEITDLSAARIITYLPGTISDVCSCIESEFSILEKIDKADELMDEGKFGYHSVHFLVTLSEERTRLSEYKRFTGLVFEIQVRTILQHAWAEMEHDIQYKSASVIPAVIRRRFIALAGMLEIADREFQALQEDDQALRVQARKSVKSGNFSNVEITPDALKTYLDGKLGGDARQTDVSYEICAEYLNHLGFTNLQQLDNCLKPYNDDSVCRALWGSRQGQITRFESVLLASMGHIYIERHPWSKDDYWKKAFPEWLQLIIEAKIIIGSYDPLLDISNQKH